MINRKEHPLAHPIDKIHFIAPHTSQLKNGAALYFLPHSQGETAHISFHFDAGSIKSSPFLVKATGALLFSGTPQKNSNTIENEIDTLGGFKSVSVSQEHTSVALLGLKENILEIAQIAINAIEKVIFPDKEIAEYLLSGKKAMQINLQKVSYLANQSFKSALFSNTPYGKITTLEDFTNVAYDDIRQFHKNNYLKGLQYITVVGNFSNEEIEAIKKLGNRFHYRAAAPLFPTFETKPAQVNIEKSDAVQTAIRIGKILFNKKHPDYMGFCVLNTILGGYFGSRLMTSIREEKGYTYGIYSGLGESLSFGHFIISTEVNKTYINDTITAIKYEIERLQNEEISIEELTIVRNYMIGQLLEKSDGAAAMLSCFMSVHKYGLDSDFYQNYIQVIQHISPKRLKELAQKHLNWEDFTIVKIG